MRVYNSRSDGGIVSLLLIKKRDINSMGNFPISYHVNYETSSIIEVLTDGSIADIRSASKYSFINIYVALDYFSDLEKNVLLIGMYVEEDQYDESPLKWILYGRNGSEFHVFLDDIDWSYKILPKTIYNSMLPCKVTCKFMGFIEPNGPHGPNKPPLL